MASLFRRISASLSSAVSRIFGRKPSRPIRTRVECIYGPPEMLGVKPVQPQPVQPQPVQPQGQDIAEPEPECIYGPPFTGCEEEPPVAALESVPQVPRELDPYGLDRITCVYGPPRR